MNLFAIVVNGKKRDIFRLRLNQELQKDLKKSFAQQKQEFLAGIKDEIIFSGPYTPEEDEVICIEGFNGAKDVVHATSSPTTTKLLDPDQQDFSNIKAIFVKDEGGDILVQTFERKRIISRGGRLALFLSKDSFVKISQPGINLDEKIIGLITAKSKLYFRSLELIRRVFDMDEYFREATNDEVNSFANNKNIDTQYDDVEKFKKNLSPRSRKKIFLIQNSAVLKKYTPSHIVQSAKEFGLSVDISEGGQIILPTDPTDLYKFLKFLDEDYYKSPLTQNRFISMSKKSVN